MTKPISTKVHGMVDYSSAGLLLSAPFLLGYDVDSPEAIVPMSIGGMTLIASLCTDYEMGATPVIDMKTHLSLDVMNGLLLAASPFLFGFAKRTWLPHVLLGLGEVATALLTATEPSRDVGQPAPVVNGRTQLEGYQHHGKQSGRQAKKNREAQGIY